MKKFFNVKVLLFFVVLIATFLRFSNIGNNPPALNWDEAALGYNAYSLGIDGKDEFGVFLPYEYIESYGDYKPPIYAYLGIVPVKVFGLNEFGVRFPSAFFGVLTVLLTYFLVKEIFKNSDKKRIDSVALASSFFLAISPWHVMLSRAAYEANVSTFFIVLGIFLFLKAINKNLWILIPSAVSFAVSLYTFNTARVFVPLFVLFMAFMFRKSLLANKKQVLISGFIGAILVLPIIPFLLSPQAKLRYQEVNIFSDLSIVKTSNQQITNDNNAPWSKIIHNRRVLYGMEFFKHYLDNLNPSFLFIKGDGNPRFSTQDVGQMYLWDLPFLVIGIFVILKKKEGHYWILPIWLLLGIIPAATARETPHALRIETVLPTFQIITAYGFIYFISTLKKYRILIASFLLLISVLSTLYFYHGLSHHYAKEYSSEWQYPYKEAVSYVSKNKDQYEGVEITEELGRPYIYFLLYSRYDPKQFRSNAQIEREAFGFVHVRTFDKYRFVESIKTDEVKSRNLYIDVAGHAPKGVDILKTFYLLNGTPSLVAYKKYD